MKRVLTFILCAAIMLGLFSPLAGFDADAADLDQIGANQTYTVSWDTDTEYKYIYLTVDETGYYDLEIEDLNGYDYGFLNFYLKDLDMNEDSYTWTNTYFGLWDITGQKSKENIYLIADHLYEIRCQYGSDAYAYPVANIQLCFTKTDYTPIELSLETNKNIVVGNDTSDYLVFRTTAAGDYMLELNQTTALWLDVYEKETGLSVFARYFGNYSVHRVRLEANTEYMIVAAGYEENSKIARLKVSKAVADVVKIDAFTNDTILAEEGWFYDQSATLLGRQIENLKYLVTFSDGNTSSWMSYYELHNSGIGIIDIYYAGDVYTYGDESFFKPGSQPFTILYMNGLRSITYIYVTPYKEFVADLNSKNDYDDLYIRYNNYSDTESHTYYWRIIPDETNMYNFYSSNWDQINDTFTIFDDNNNVVPRYDDDWALKAGKEYSLRVTYSYKENCYDDVKFYLAPARDHVHSYSNAWDTSCDICDAERTVSLSKTAPSFFKATLTGHNDVKLTWKAGSGATHYYVYYRRAGKAEWKLATTTTGLTYTIKDLVDNGKYEFKVVSYLKDATGTYKGGSTSVVSCSTTRDLKAPSKVTAKLYGYDDVKISWSKVSGAKGYKVYYKLSTAKSYSYIGFTTGTSIKKANLSDGVKYTFKVVPCTKVNGGYFEDDSIKTATATTLKAVSTPKVAKYSSSKVKVSWTDIAGESGYQVAITSDKAGKKIITSTATTGKSKTMTAKKGKTCYYKVRAYKTVDGKKIYAPWSKVKAYKLK